MSEQKTITADERKTAFLEDLTAVLRKHGAVMYARTEFSDRHEYSWPVTQIVLTGKYERDGGEIPVLAEHAEFTIEGLQ